MGAVAVGVGRCRELARHEALRVADAIRRRSLGHGCVYAEVVDRVDAAVDERDADAGAEEASGPERGCVDGLGDVFAVGCNGGEDGGWGRPARSKCVVDRDVEHVRVLLDGVERGGRYVCRRRVQAVHVAAHGCAEAGQVLVGNAVGCLPVLNDDAELADP